MPTTKVTFPNIRRLFVPDPGYTLADADLEGADAQVVAWEADDEDLKTAFRARQNVHEKNARDLFSDVLRGRSAKTVIDEASVGHLPYYDLIKRAVHGTNYMAGINTLSVTLGWQKSRLAQFQRKWFALHPGIREWQNRVEFALQTKRVIENQLGFHCPFLGRVDQALPEALAWGPQSTVASNTFMGAIRLEELLTSLHRYHDCKLSGMLVPVHDSAVFQYPTRLEDELLPRIHAALHVSIPYPDPLTIPWGLTTSTKSWGDCAPKEWTTA